MSKTTARKRSAASRRIKARRQKRIIITVFSVFMFFVVTASCVAMKMIYDVGQTMDKVYEPVKKQNFRKNTLSVESTPKENEVSEAIDYQSLVKHADPIAILLIGTDTGDFGRTEVNGLADVIIYCVLNPEEESMTMLSIPRDSYVELPGYGYDKINASYQYGGAELTIATVQNLLGLPVDAYAVVNFKGFQKVVDAIGGVTVKNSFEFSYGGYTFPEGRVSLDGKQALAFVRMRYDDPESDFGRGRRQRNVVIAMAKKVQSLSGALNYQDILSAVEGNVLTDIDLDSALEMLSEYSDCLNNIDNMDTLKGSDDSIDDIYVYRLSQTNLNKICDQLRSELELDQDGDDD